MQSKIVRPSLSALIEKLPQNRTSIAWIRLSGGNIANIVLMQVIIQGFSLMFALSYEVFFVWKYDATPGKMVMGLKILRPDGAKLSVGRIVGRYFATIVSAIPLGIGYIMAAFDEEARALHDRIVDSRVFRTK